MDLYEYQGKELFRRYGIPTSDGRLATTPEEARAAAEELGGTVVVKAQVLTGGRGKAGGIKLADEPGRGGGARARHPRHGHPRPRRAQALDRARLRHRQGVLPLAHLRPGREEAALDVHDARAGWTSRRSPRRSPRRSCACTSTRSRASSPGRRAGSSTAPASRTRASRSRSPRIVEKLYAAFVGCDAMLCEVNPLIVTPDGEVRALDSKFTVDDNALYKHPDIAEMRDLEAYPPRSAPAREKDVTYVKLDGEVGILGNGAGLVMSTLDVIAQAGGRPANFCDLGGGGDAQGVVDALEIITADPQVKSIFFNIFGGITRCDEVARGILQALDQMPIDDPIVVRLDGTNAEEGGGCSRRPRRRTCTRRRRCWTRPGARWSSRRRDDRRLVGARRGLPHRGRAGVGRRPRPHRRVGGRREERARRRHRRRPRRAAAARGRASRSRRSIRRRGCGRTWSAERRGDPVRGLLASTSSSRASRRTTSPTCAPPSREMARVACDQVIVEDTLYASRAPSRRPRGCATRRTCARTPRTSGARCSRTPACASRRSSCTRSAIRSRRGSRGRAARARRPSACASCSPTTSSGDEYVDTKILLRARKDAG